MAFSQNVCYIRAHTQADNEPSKSVLEKCKFKTVFEQDGCFLFEREKPVSAWTEIYMSIGFGGGVSFGTAIEYNMALGICIGLTIGIALGIALDANDIKKRKRLIYTFN